MKCYACGSKDLKVKKVWHMPYENTKVRRIWCLKCSAGMTTKEFIIRKGYVKQPIPKNI